MKRLIPALVLLIAAVLALPGAGDAQEVTAKVQTTPTQKPAKVQTATATPRPTKTVTKTVTKATAKPTAKPTPKPTPKPTRSGIQAGATLRGSLTYYCCCPKCCGKHVKQVKKGVYRSTTASGMRVQTGQAPPYPIASCNWLPLGSQVEAGGVVYTIEDRGGGGLSKRGNLDVYVYQGHKKALAMGRKSVTIRIVRVGR
jgi:3D (Asp-Asp-Asp) domain-containing protein